MSTLATIDPKAVQSQELLEMLLNFSVEEIGKFRRLLNHAEMLKRNGREESDNAWLPRRFIDPDDGGPVWELGFIDEFDRASCYEDTRSAL